jgi:ABC-type multidrug transport system ATPase subunit
MSDAMLGVEHLSVRANQRLLVDRVSLCAQAGEFTAVIGPNGAGKTSLLEAIVGVRPSDGTVQAFGKTLSTFRSRARTFAYLPDQSEAAAELSSRVVVEHALSCASGSVDVAELRGLLAIDSLLDLGVGVLSRGERQRLALFSTLVLGRPVVVLDEPFSAFDPLQLRDVLRAIRSIAASGAIILASIHQLADAEKIADRVLLLAGGRAIAFGTPAELRAKAERADMTLEEVFLTLLARQVP